MPRAAILRMQPGVTFGFLVLLGICEAGLGQAEQVAKLTASDPGVGDNVGYSGSIDLDTVILGAPGADISGIEDNGAAYVFRRIDGFWEQEAKLSPADLGIDNRFGEAVSISGDISVVSAVAGDAPGVSNCGAAHVFERVGSTWAEVAKLVAGDADNGDSFGYSVGVSGETVVVGAPDEGDTFFSSGAAYVFRNVDGTWQEIAKLTASDQAGNDYFGSAVAIDGGKIVVGAPGDDTAAGPDSGSVYVFEEIGGVWMEITRISPVVSAPFDGFGVSVTISGDTLAGGSSLDDDLAVNQGSVTIFRSIGGVWTEVAMVTALDASADDEFGWRIDYDGVTLVVGSYLDNGVARDSGSAYVFAEIDNVWTQIDHLTADDAALTDQFSRSVGVSGDFVVCGSWQDNLPGVQDAGSGYVYDLVPDPPPPLTLTVTATCPDGGELIASWTGATPGGIIALLYGRNMGSFVIPEGNTCAGTQLGLGSFGLQVVYQGNAGQQGSREVIGNAGAGTCGSFLQLLDVSTCTTSNVETID